MYKVHAPPSLLILTPLEEKETKIYLGNSKEELPTQGTVVSVGAGLDQDWLGREVLFKKFGAQTFEFNDTKYLSMPEKEIVAVLVSEV